MHSKVHLRKNRFKKKKIITIYKPKLSAILINNQTSILIDKQIESARRVISKKTQRVGKLYIQIFTKQPTTKKSKGSRMGKGKGKFNCFIYLLRPGQFVFKLFSNSLTNAISALNFAKKKLPNLNTLIY